MNASVTPAPQRSDLPLRAATAIVMAAIVLGATWVGGLPFRALWALAGAAVAYEWLTMVKAKAPLPLAAAAGLMALGLAAPHYPPVWTLCAVLLATAILFYTTRHAASALGLGYAAVIALVPAALRDIAGFGFWVILWSFAVVWASDIAGYFVGRALGGPKLLPAISPKKTWSGAIGGLIAGTACGCGIWWAAGHYGAVIPISLPVVALVSACASILGQIGDLAESGLKRVYGVKDSSHLIPGHGGFMDRLDAYWAVMALAGLLLLR